ncbi:hypothetical protein LMIY3S_04513 [Labrys miyagiensis]
MRYRSGEALKYLHEKHGVKLAAQTLAKLRCVGGGPAFQHFGRWPLYDEADLDTWVHERLSGRKTSTSDTGARVEEAA